MARRLRLLAGGVLGAIGCVAVAATNATGNSGDVESLAAIEGLVAGLRALRIGDYEEFSRACGFAHMEIETLAESGVAEAQLCLVFMHAYGWDRESDPAATLAWVRRAADNGLREAQFLLGRHTVLAAGDGPETAGIRDFRHTTENSPGFRNDAHRKADWHEGMSWLEQAATNGSPNAQLHLAMVAREPSVAIELFGRAAVQGCSYAAYELGAARPSSDRTGAG